MKLFFIFGTSRTWVMVVCDILPPTSFDVKLQFGATPSKEVLGYCDVDWGGDLEDRRSTTGFVFIMGGGAIS